MVAKRGEKVNADQARSTSISSQVLACTRLFSQSRICLPAISGNPPLRSPTSNAGQICSLVRSRAGLRSEDIGVELAFLENSELRSGEKGCRIIPMNQELENYIEQSRQQGLSDAEIKKQLVNTGWQERDINLAFSSGTSVNSSPRKKYFIKIAIPLIVILIILSGGISYYLYSKNIDSNPVPVEVSDTGSTKLFTIPQSQKINEWLFDMSYWLTFSKDAKQFAYITGENNNNFLVLNGKEIHETSPNSAISMGGFSPDGKHFAYLAGYISRSPNDSDYRYMVVDGNKGQVYDEIRWFSWSSDSQHYAYYGAKNSREIWVLDGKEFSSHAKVGSFVFSPDGEGYAYSYQTENNQWVVVINGKESLPYERVDSTPVFSSDGKRVAFMAQKNGFWYVTVDGQQQAKGYQRIGELLFSPDGKQFAYVAYDENYKRLLVLNGKAGQAYDDIQRVTFGPNNRLVFQVTKNEKLFMSDNGKMTEISGFFSSLFFSPDGNHIAYIISDDMDHSFKVVLDGQKSKGYENIGNIIFSPDSKHLAYSEWKRSFTAEATTDSKQHKPPAHYQAFMVVDGKESKVFGGQIFNPKFSTDSKSIEYGVSDGPVLWHVVEKVE